MPKFTIGEKVKITASVEQLIDISLSEKYKDLELTVSNIETSSIDWGVTTTGDYNNEPVYLFEENGANVPESFLETFKIIPL